MTIFLFTLFEQPIKWLELIAMITGIVGVWLTVKQNILCFPVGIVNVALYAILFIDPSVRLYADALLQCVYLILLAYGWINWKRRQVESTLSIPDKTSPELFMKLFLILIFGTFLMGFCFHHFTNAALPYLDSFLTTLSLIAQWMVAKKKIENWLLWILADLIYIPVYLIKNLPLTAGLYILFLLMAILGWKEWKKSMTQKISVS